MPGVKFTCPDQDGPTASRGIGTLFDAVARNPEQAVPLSGTYWGDRDEELAMEVEVMSKEAAPPGAEPKSCEVIEVPFHSHFVMDRKASNEDPCGIRHRFYGVSTHSNDSHAFGSPVPDEGSPDKPKNTDGAPSAAT
jgi:hypothetical protein